MEKYVSKKGQEKLKLAAEQELGSTYDLPFDTFWQCCGGDFSHLGDATNPTVLQVYWVKRFKEFVEEYTAALKALVVRPTADEEKATAEAGLLEVTFGESMLVFLRDYFGLPSFEEAGRRTMAELLIAKRATFNQERYKRKLTQIQTAKLHKK